MIDPKDLRPFVLAEALAGAKVYTRDGREEVNEWHVFDGVGIAMVVNSVLGICSLNGDCGYLHATRFDLMLGPLPKRKLWINEYEDGNFSAPHATKESVDIAATHRIRRIACHEVEIPARESGGETGGKG